MTNQIRTIVTHEKIEKANTKGKRYQRDMDRETIKKGVYKVESDKLQAERLVIPLFGGPRIKWNINLSQNPPFPLPLITEFSATSKRLKLMNST